MITRKPKCECGAGFHEHNPETKLRESPDSWMRSCYGYKPEPNEEPVLEVSEHEFSNFSNGQCGLCLECGDVQEGGCEPDAKNYLCENCGAEKVCGFELAMLMGRIRVV